MGENLTLDQLPITNYQLPILNYQFKGVNQCLRQLMKFWKN
jgi:hypothetical protein